MLMAENQVEKDRAKPTTLSFMVFILGLDRNHAPFHRSLSSYLPAIFHAINHPLSNLSTGWVDLFLLRGSPKQHVKRNVHGCWSAGPPEHRKTRENTLDALGFCITSALVPIPIPIQREVTHHHAAVDPKTGRNCSVRFRSQRERHPHSHDQILDRKEELCKRSTINNDGSILEKFVCILGFLQEDYCRRGTSFLL